MSEMVERVARAICTRRMSRGTWDRASEVERDEWPRDDRSAIEAMREPREAMIETGNDSFDNHIEDNDPSPLRLILRSERPFRS